MKNISMEISQYVDAALALHDLELDAARRAEVEKQFRLLSGMYLLIESDPISDEIEPANIYRL